MIKKLSLLNGLAIIGVILNHVGYFGLEAVFYGGNPVSQAGNMNLSQLGSFVYYQIIIMRQLSSFCVPAFFFISGFFIAYACRGNPNSSSTRYVFKRLPFLLTPYLIWSIVILFGDVLQDKTFGFFDYAWMLLNSGAIRTYWFIPVLLYYYILSIAIAPLAKNHWKLLLICSAVIQLSAAGVFYLPLMHIDFPGLQFLLDITTFSSPLNSILYFTFGIVFGFHLDEIKQFLLPKRVALIIGLIAFFLLSVFETDFLIRSTLNIYIGAFMGTISFNLFSFFFIFVFIVLEKIPLSNALIQLGSKSYGIYLLHAIFLLVFIKFLLYFWPQAVNYPILYQVLLVALGLGGPYLLMTIISQTPMRRYYRYLFG